MLARAKIRCKIMEADKDAEALRAQKYHQILLELSGEDIDSFHTQATNTPPTSEGTSVRPASPPVCPMVCTEPRGIGLSDLDFLPAVIAPCEEHEKYTRAGLSPA